MEAVFAAIPVKDTEESKSRLSSLLQPHERACLTLTMLKDVVRTIFDSQAFSKVVVISSDSKILRLTSGLGTYTVRERGCDLNRAVEQVTRWCIRKGAHSTLILPSDIPLLTIEDINQLIYLSAGKRSVVVSPSNGGGTNALFRTPSDVIPPSFGSSSFIKHLSAARSADIKAKVYRSPSIALDIDSINDLERLLHEPRETQTHTLLRELDISSRLRTR